jgi:P-type E1-E2 ATPase
LDSDAAQGLSQAGAQQRLAQIGPNELVEKGGRTRWSIIREQLTGVLTILLFVAALISAFLGDWIEAVVILIIVVLNAVLGYTQEYKAEQSMAALKRMSVPKVRVRRGGQAQEVSAIDLVPGDVVILETGNIVPADGRVLQSVNLRVEEAALTGESEPVDKDEKLVFESDRALGDRRNMLYSGTIVMSLLSIGAGLNFWQAGQAQWQTVLFTTLVFSQLAVAVGARSELNSVLRVGLFSNRSMVLAMALTVALQLVVIYLPLAQSIFGTTTLTASELALTAGLALLTLLAVELWKLVLRRRAV